MVTNPEHSNCSEEVSFGLFDEIAHSAILSPADVLLYKWKLVMSPDEVGSNSTADCVSSVVTATLASYIQMERQQNDAAYVLMFGQV